jgi:uracil-DNA glycosylase
MKDLIKKIKECEKCEICGQTKNKSIGRGSQAPRILFVGLNPGTVENGNGIPFSGPSGQLLDEWVKHLGLGSEDYAVVNLSNVIPGLKVTSVGRGPELPSLSPRTNTNPRSYLYHSSRIKTNPHSS